jgi:abnormal spindle-like microcephaly-associated protein
VGKLSLSKPGSSSSSSSSNNNKLAASMPLLAEKKGAGAAAHPPASTRKPLSSSTVNAGTAAKKGQQLQKGDHDEDRKKASAFAKPPPGSIKTLSLAKPVAAKPQKLPSEGVMPPVHCLFDDQWREKQEACFSEWINFMFAEEVSAAEAEAAESTYRALERRRHDDRVRWRVASVWESPEVRQIMYKVDKEVKLERLLMRMDRMVHTDVGLRDLLLQILLSINTASLRPALEVIYNQAIPRTHASDSVNLHRFLTSRLTKNPDILSKFAINGSCSELNTSPGFYKELNSFILLKFLQIILLLDRSKIGGALDGCLFNKAASVPGPHGTIKLLPIRSTKDALVRFSKEFLSGEGDVIRHLSLLGMSLTFQQTPLDEFDMTVTALASDLRDGVRLAQLVDRVAPPCSGNEIRQKLRVPAISRLQKVHNVNLALDRLKNLGLIQGNDKDLARDVVDGHREQTLGLLWLLMSNYQLPSVIAPSTLKEEIARILLQKRRSQRSGRRPGQAGGDANPGRESNVCSNAPLSGDIVELLLRWCQSVCSPLGAQVHNFTTSFADGRVLCTLIHAYIPGMLPLAAIQPTRCDVVGSTAQGAADADIAERHGTWAYCMMDRSSPGYAAALAGEKENLKMAMSCAQQVRPCARTL